MKFDDSQAEKLISAANILENYEYILNNISKNIETMNITQINLKYQLDQQIKKFPNLMARLRAEGDALTQIMYEYNKAENNVQNGFQNNSGVTSALASLVNFWSSIITTWTSGIAQRVKDIFKNAAKEIDRQLNPEPEPTVNPEPTVAESVYVKPVTGIITDRYGSTVNHPNGHKGIDIGAGTGTTVSAAASGTVTLAGWNGDYGNCVIIEDSTTGIRTLYAHLSTISVAKGDSITSGIKVGQVGSTGRSTGPHLHFEVKQNGVFQNPEDFFSEYFQF